MKMIQEMAREAGFHRWDTKNLEAFAALVRADERDKWMERTVILIRGEREACAKVCEDSVEYAGDTLAEAIRARGQA